MARTRRPVHGRGAGIRLTEPFVRNHTSRVAGPDLDLTHIDLTDPDVFERGVPWDWFAFLRREHPVFWHPETAPNAGFWSVMRYRDVDRVMNEPGTFRSGAGITFEEMEPDELAARRSMMETDPPRHTRMRRIVSPLFTPRAMREYEPFCREVARQVLDEALDRRAFDFVEEISRQLPIRVLARVLGVPDGDTDQLIEWGDRMIGNMDPEFTDMVVDRVDTSAYRLLPFRSPAAAELTAYGHRMAELRRDDPRNDLVSKLVHAEVEGLKLTTPEFDNFFSLLVVAGNETTRHTITHGMLTLMDHRDAWRRMVEDPTLIPSAVEEILRYSSVTMNFRRTATRDVELGGKPVHEGDKVVVWYISADRDEETFARPDEFDITRTPNPEVAFGSGGPHFCLGAPLARMEIRVMFEELLPRLADIELTGPVSRLRSNFINGVKHMPVRVETA
jgi:cytochrome P450